MAMGKASAGTAHGKASSKAARAARTSQRLGRSAARARSGAGAGRHGGGRSAEDLLKELKQRLLELSDLGAACALLGWDQATYMPKGGAAARARQSATLSRLAHEKFTDPALGKLLDRLAGYAETLPYASDDASLIRVVRHDYDKATRVPAEFVARWSALGTASFDSWTRARPANDFAGMRPFLEKALGFSRQYAEFLGPYDHIADPLIDGADAGM